MCWNRIEINEPRVYGLCVRQRPWTTLRGTSSIVNFNFHQIPWHRPSSTIRTEAHRHTCTRIKIITIPKTSHPHYHLERLPRVPYTKCFQQQQFDAILRRFIFFSSDRRSIASVQLRFNFRSKYLGISLIGKRQRGRGIITGERGHISSRTATNWINKNSFHF